MTMNFETRTVINAGKECRTAAPCRRSKNLKEIDVHSLFEGEREIALLHRGEVYSLRITANNKLILTK